MIRHLSILFLLCLGSLLPAIAQESIRFRQFVSQTSVWPGDRIQYRIDLTVPSQIKVATEDFEIQNVNFEPFFMLGRTFEESQGENGVVEYTIEYRLSNLEIGDQQLEIPPLLFRYEDRAAADTGPATREMRIPAYPIAGRTTLNADLDQSWIRESLPPSDYPGYPYWMIVLGLAGVVVSSFPLLTWAWSRLPEWQARRQRMGRREFLNQWQQSLTRLDGGDDPTAIKEHYSQLDQLVRGYIDYFWEVDSHGLTPRELEAQFRQENGWNADEQKLIQVLDNAEQCCYGPDDSDRWLPALKQDLAAIRGIKTR